MPGIKSQVPYTCARHLRAPQRRNASSIVPKTRIRRFSVSPLYSLAAKVEEKEDQSTVEAKVLEQSPKSSPESSHDNEPERGAMSRRLAEATEDALLEGGRAGRKAVEEAGFSEELKNKLLEKVEAAKFRSEYATAFAEAGMTSNVGRGSREIATGQAWDGEESTEDAVLRMLDDARKPLKPGMRGPAKIPSPIVDLRLQPRPKVRPGERLANARDKTSLYATSKDAPMTDKEREELRKELKERFTPGARPMPTSFRGLASLANERIEDAIARGQFKNIPRGKAIERDPRADNPFINTTEYIMNKMIQRQDIVPPWIEKQQELVKAANVFRARLRNDWKRHAARTIASRGGSLQDQMRMAERYAESERVHNPKKRPVEQVSVPTNATDDPVMVKIIQEVSPPSDSPEGQVSVTTDDGEITITETIRDTPQEESPSTASRETSQEEPTSTATPLPAPFRLPEWEAAEMSYLQLAVNNLNNLTRTYNLMAPDLAKKPYFSLERELQSCYADVAPELSEAIKERAARPAKDLVGKTGDRSGDRSGGMFEAFAAKKAVVYDDKKPLYGFKEFWKDLWGNKSAY